MLPCHRLTFLTLANPSVKSATMLLIMSVSCLSVDACRKPHFPKIPLVFGLSAKGMNIFLVIAGAAQSDGVEITCM